jgi:UPF0716 family protein affecting phage T7 exclusion
MRTSGVLILMALSFAIGWGLRQWQLQRAFSNLGEQMRQGFNKMNKDRGRSNLAC